MLKRVVYDEMTYDCREFSFLGGFFWGIRAFIKTIVE